MVDRVRRPKEYELFMKKIANTAGGNNQIFETYKDCLVFCATLGFKKDRRKEFNESAEPIQIQIFSGEYDKAIINSMALVETNDPHVLSQDREGERINIFEEYACGGLSILASELQEGMDTERQILALIHNESKGRSIIDDISDI